MAKILCSFIIFHTDVHLGNYSLIHIVDVYFKISTNLIFLKSFKSILASVISMSIRLNVINMLPMDIISPISQFL